MKSKITNEHKKGVKAVIYNKKPQPHIGPDALKKSEKVKKKPTAKAPQPMGESDESRLYKYHQELRKKRGLPDPEHYKKLGQQKQKEIDALRKEIEDDKMKTNEEQTGQVVDYKPGQTATINTGPGMTTILDLKKNPTSLTKDPTTGKLKLMGPTAAGQPAQTATQATTIKTGDAVEIAKEDDVSRLLNLAGLQEAPVQPTTAAPAPQAAPTAAPATAAAQPQAKPVAPAIKVPPVPALPQVPQGVEGEQTSTGGVSYQLAGGSKLTVNQDGTKSYAGEWGTFTYDKAGKAIKYNAPGVGGMSGSVDLTTGGQATNYAVGDVAASQTQNAAGKVTGTSATYSPATQASQTVTNSTEGLDSILRLAGLAERNF